MIILMRVALLALLIAAPARAAFAQGPALPPSIPAGPDSITDQIMKRRHHLEEYLTLMKDSNQATRLAAVQQALTDSDPIVRGSAISFYLKRFSNLTPEVNMDKVPAIPPQELPRLVINDITWNEAGTSGTAFHSSCNGNSRVQIQISGGKVAVAYDEICLRTSLYGNDFNVSGNEARKQVATSCQLTLAPSADETALDGLLHCIGLTTPLPVTLPFGP